MSIRNKISSVSVVIPCYRCAETINRAVDSVLSQSLLPYEIILIDDCSNDNTIDVLNKIAANKNISIKIRLIALKENLGAANARNVGWNAANQQYVAFLDSDDSWHPKKLEVQYNYMIENDIDFSGHRCRLFNASLTIDGVDRLCVSTTMITAKSLLFKNAFSTPTVMLKTSIPLRFHFQKRYAEDFMLWQEIAFNQYKMARLEINLAYVHKDFYGFSGLSANLWRMEKGEISNFYFLFKRKYITWYMYFLAVLFSLLKFIKRLLISFCKKL